MYHMDTGEAIIVWFDRAGSRVMRAAETKK
jgi:hypothetical protein